MASIMCMNNNLGNAADDAVVCKLDRFFAFALLMLPLGGCDASLFLGFGMPSHEACRDAAVLPGQPIGNDCRDSLGR
jgi:hypothetical protein